MVKTATYSHTNSYEVVNPITATTKNIWICMHGLGYLSKYFKKYFKTLDPAIHAVIVPQAPSKFYIGDTFKNVGACWLTRVDTMQEMDNNLNYYTYCNRFIHISGLRDEYVTPEIISREKNKIAMLFGTKCEVHTPDITHEVAVPLLHQIAQSL